MSRDQTWRMPCSLLLARGAGVGWSNVGSRFRAVDKMSSQGALSTDGLAGPIRGCEASGRCRYSHFLISFLRYRPGEAWTSNLCGSQKIVKRVTQHCPSTSHVSPTQQRVLLRMSNLENVTSSTRCGGLRVPEASVVLSSSPLLFSNYPNFFNVNRLTLAVPVPHHGHLSGQSIADLLQTMRLQG